MIVRKGKSMDHSEERRREIFNTYQAHCHEMADIDIAKKLGYETGVSLSHFKRTKWWLSLETEAQRRAEIGN